MHYTGAPDAVCPITLVALPELYCPVAFRFAPHQPYECLALIEWLQESMTNPMTNLEVSWRHSALEIIGPLGPRSELATSMLETRLPSILSKSIKDGWIWLYFVTMLSTIIYNRQMLSNSIFIVYTIVHTWLNAKAKGRMIFATGAMVIGSALISFWILDNVINPFHFTSIVITALKGIAHSVDLYHRMHRRNS